ncbi:hypothetical protein [Aquibacillus rhizosphaerae]|uniref:Transporter n=1 Tax=Aquibacillus rhizosphaerae TaxID=3051431 RepID=A0ABT7LBK3_9BACI|nr:hypothetical protein [Aquibacillus sp. LR5S19]MDL4843257.1 hypothetical protein [Aquibacillus sp. LR5S19]
MYSTNEKGYLQNSYEQNSFPLSVPFQPNNFPHVTVDERQMIPNFPWQGGSMGPQIGFPGSPPTTPPGQDMQGGPPTSPPPSYVPTQAQTQQASTFAVDPGSISGCLFKFTYVWARGFQQFWFYPTFVGRDSVSGYRWIGFRWVYSGISLRQIQSFTCF